MGIPITELAEVIRSKLRSYTPTMDIIFRLQSIQKIVGEKAISPELISRIYKTQKKDILSIINLTRQKP